MRTLGVLGGMGPAATAEFLRLFAADVPAATDQQHPRILMLSDPAVPERTAAILHNDDTPLQRIREGLLTLTQWGADVLVVPCNTAHVFVDRISLPIPLVHIVHATLREAVAGSPNGSWLAASSGTLASGLYQRLAREVGYRLLVPDRETQTAIHDSSVLVKANRTLDAAERFRGAVEMLWRQDELPVLAACTELPLAYTASALPPGRMISSLAALSAACVAEVYNRAPAQRPAGQYNQL